MDDEKKIMGKKEVWKIKKMMVFQRKYGWWKNNHGLEQSMEDKKKWWHFKESMDDEKKKMGLSWSMEDLVDTNTHKNKTKNVLIP